MRGGLFSRGEGDMYTLLQDLRYFFRQARRTPGHYGLILLILALGIGANYAIFSQLNQALFKPLPCKNEERVMKLTTQTEETPSFGMSYPDIAGFQAPEPFL